MHQQPRTQAWHACRKMHLPAEVLCITVQNPSCKSLCHQHSPKGDTHSLLLQLLCANSQRLAAQVGALQVIPCNNGTTFTCDLCRSSPVTTAPFQVIPCNNGTFAGHPLQQWHFCRLCMHMQLCRSSPATTTPHSHVHHACMQRRCMGSSAEPHVNHSSTACVRTGTTCMHAEQ